MATGIILNHAMLFVQYLLNNGERIELEAIAKPAVELVSAKAKKFTKKMLEKQD